MRYAALVQFALFLGGFSQANLFTCSPFTGDKSRAAASVRRKACDTRALVTKQLVFFGGHWLSSVNLYLANSDPCNQISAAQEEVEGRPR